MHIAFRLRRRSTPAPASALLLLSRQTPDLLRLCTRLGCDPLPPVYAVADGFLLKLPRPTTAAFGGVIRLCHLADNLLLPVDADLVPVLLPDEAAGLVRCRGLVFLPGGRVLEFDPAHPVPLSAMLGAGLLRRGAWRPLPQPEPLAERLTEITLDQPEMSVDELPPTEDAAGAGEEAPTSDAGLPAQVFGKAAFGAGKALTWLGKTFGLSGLAATGMRWMGAGLGWAPALAESVLGRQEAALRELLRAFREGRVEEALRRALPVGDNPRGARPSGSANLPFHNLRYSLRNILSSGSGGGGSIWHTEADLYHELEREYRRQAELAVQRGDYRRAAFIHGKLLHDYRAAAAVLSRGGLHRDAAALYLKKLGDPLAAAREYEAAGEIDRALSIYRRHGEHLHAAELLRRAGDEEQALEEYRRAADKLAATNASAGYYEAGELLRTRAGREDMALPYYEAGWERRPAGSPIPCAIRLAQTYARDEATEQLTALAAAAAEYLGRPGSAVVAAEFYNELVRQADRLSQAEVRDDLRDLALTGLVGKIRQRVGSGGGQPNLVSTMLGTAKVWPAPVVSDAQFAVRQAGKAQRSQTGAVSCSSVVLRAVKQTVSAVCQAAQSGDIFVGFESGEVYCFRPASGELTVVIEESRPIRSLAATPNGDALVVMSSHIPESASLKSLVRHQPYYVKDNMFLAEWPRELCPALVDDGGRHIVGVRTARGLELFQGPQLLRIDCWEWPVEEFDPGATFLWPFFRQSRSVPSVLALCDHEFVFWECDSEGHASTSRCGGGWRPGVSAAGGLAHPVFSWLDKGAEGLELAGVDSEGCLYASDLRLIGGKLSNASTKALSGEQPFLAAAILRSGVVAAATRNAVHWLRREADGLRPLGSLNVSMPTPAACFRHHGSKELIVVCANGTLVSVPGLPP